MMPPHQGCKHRHIGEEYSPSRPKASSVAYGHGTHNVDDNDVGRLPGIVRTANVSDSGDTFSGDTNDITTSASQSSTPRRRKRDHDFHLLLPTDDDNAGLASSGRKSKPLPSEFASLIAPRKTRVRRATLAASAVAVLSILALVLPARILNGYHGYASERWWDGVSFLNPQILDLGFGGNARERDKSTYEAAFERRRRERRARTRPPAPLSRGRLKGGRAKSEDGGYTGKEWKERMGRPAVMVTKSGTPFLLSTSRSAQELDSEVEGGKSGLAASTTGHTIPAGFNVTNLCGAHAQSAAARHSFKYPPELTLGPSSRIVITGVLNQIGFHLALALFDECHVDTIFGLDSLLPHSPKERMVMMDRYMILKRKKIHKLVVPFVGVTPKGDGKDWANEIEKEWDLVNEFKPTHVVHLASYAEGMEDTPSFGDVSGVSWYGDHTKFQLSRNSMVGMEQILDSIRRTGTLEEAERRVKQKAADSDDKKLKKEKNEEKVDESNAEISNLRRPHLVYASSAAVGLDTPQSVNVLSATYGTTKFVDELLASTYHELHSVPSVGFRFSTVYGPWGRPGSAIYQMFERAVDNNRTLPIVTNDVLRKLGKGRSRWVYVDDVVGALIAGMQYRQEAPAVFGIAGSKIITVEDLAGQMEHSFPREGEIGAVVDEIATSYDRVATVLAADSVDSDSSLRRTQEYLGWKASTSLPDGVLSTLAWHFGRHYPFGPPIRGPVPPRPENLYSRRNLTPPSDTPPALPCASGCGIPEYCAPSIYDNVIPVSKNITSKCDYVLYLVNLWPDEEIIAKMSKESDDEVRESKVCKLAFVALDGKIAKKEVSLSAKLAKGEELGPLHYAKYNGKLQHSGWTLLFVPGNAATIPEADFSLAKLSPRNLFASNVKKAMYVHPEKFPPPSTDSVHMLMRYVDAKAQKPGHEWATKQGKQVRVTTPAAPARRTLLFLPEDKFPEDIFKGAKDSVSAVASYILERDGIKNNKRIANQQLMYQHASSLVRTGLLRSPHVAKFADRPMQYGRSAWIIHELTLEESRQLRCEWYQEQVFWGNSEFDDFSLGFVLARRRVTRVHGLEDDEWNPLMRESRRPTAQEVEGSAEDLHVTDDKGAELYLRFLKRTMQVKKKKVKKRSDDSAENEKEEENDAKDGKESSNTEDADDSMEKDEDKKRDGGDKEDGQDDDTFSEEELAAA